MLSSISLQRKQALTILLTSGVSLGLACAAFIGYEMVSQRSRVEAQLSSLARMVGEAKLASPSAEQATSLGSVGENSRVSGIRVYGPTGELLASYGRAEPGANGSNSPLLEQPRNRIAVTQNVEANGQVLGRVWIESELERLSQRLARHTGIAAGVLVAGFLIALVFSARLQRVVSQPILELAAMARRVSREKDYSLRAVVRTQDELGEMVRCFNDMLDAIQARDEALAANRDDLEKRVATRTLALQEEIAERGKAEEQLQQQLARMSLLHSISRAIVDRRDLESLMTAVLRQLEDHLPIELGRVYLYDESSDTLAAATRHHSRKMETHETILFGASIPLEESGLTECRQGQSVVIDDTTSGNTLIHRKLTEAKFGSAVAMPLMLQQRLFGVLVTARREAHAFSPSDCNFLRMLSEQLALAANEARLHELLQKAYDDLRQTQQAVMREERLHALGQMASGIAHDINNALCPIVVFSDLLLQKPGQFDECTLKYLLHIKTAGEDIAHIVSRMREFYRRRGESDKLSPVNLNTVALQVVEMTRPRWRDIPQSRGQTIELRTEFDPQLAPMMGDLAEIREAITNLILNSVDAMPQGGCLVIRTHTRNLGQTKVSKFQPAQAVLEVCDSGAGMDEETKKRCLEPFFSTKGQLGTGLGLAMVYGIMERHDGRIEIESEPGRGTTVRLVFPLRLVTPDSSPNTGKPLLPPPGLNVLFIDDEPLLRVMLKQILEYSGHFVQVADGGASGLDRFRTARKAGKPFDVVITDLGMPHVDGRQVAKVLKRESPDTPVVMLTGWGGMMKDDGDIPAQVDGILSKPPKISELYELLGHVLQNRHQEAQPTRN